MKYCEKIIVTKCMMMTYVNLVAIKVEIILKNYFTHNIIFNSISYRKLNQAYKSTRKLLKSVLC